MLRRHFPGAIDETPRRICEHGRGLHAVSEAPAAILAPNQELAHNGSPKVHTLTLQV
jgi:hypothetical protein